MERPPQESWAPERLGKRLPQGAETGPCPTSHQGHSPGLEALTSSLGASARFPGLSANLRPRIHQEQCVLGRHLQTRSRGARPVGGSRPLRENFYVFHSDDIRDLNEAHLTGPHHGWASVTRV